MSNEDYKNDRDYQEKMFWAKFELLRPEDQKLVVDKLEQYLDERDQNRFRSIVSDGNDINLPDEK